MNLLTRSILVVIAIMSMAVTAATLISIRGSDEASEARAKPVILIRSCGKRVSA